MNLPSINFSIEVTKMVNGYVARHTFNCGVGSTQLQADPVYLPDEAALKAYLQALSREVK
jgi:hypothetical protein